MSVLLFFETDNQRFICSHGSACLLLLSLLKGMNRKFLQQRSPFPPPPRIWRRREKGRADPLHVHTGARKGERTCQQKKGARVQLFPWAWMGSMIACAPRSASEIPNASEGATATRTMIPSAATLMLCRANRADHVA
jgi:hypothetical protein